MASTIKLSGNLGDRHRLLNSLVRDTDCSTIDWSTIQHYTEPTDRIFGIDLASKQKNVDYILHTLKDDDMLYVSRALKSFWLLKSEWSNVINPIYLEGELFPQMRLQAVSKMRNWIRLHLRDPERCKEFYQFYKSSDFDAAAKFLWHCSNEFIQNEVSNILEKITPKLLKVLSEKVPKVTKIYFDSIRGNQTILEYYLDNELKFFANIKYLLKLDADVFFYVLENFFANDGFPAFNSTITNHIMRHHNSKFIMKPELYTSRILNIEAVAKNLNPEEIKELVVKLAKAEYLGSWFKYQTVESLIKRINVEERKAFKKLVFVDKAFGETVKEWPYPIPAPSEFTTPQINLFEDMMIERIHYPFKNDCYMECDMIFRAMSKKRKYAKWLPEKTLLDDLFEKYRFSNYKETLLELQKRLKAESSAKNRQYMLLVLISKTGGQAEDLASFLDLLLNYKNEPVQIRAAIIRSLVKRAFVWRLAPEHWARLLTWGHGLGLDGSPAEAACHEGLDAVILRDLLTGATPTDAVWNAYLRDFSPLAEYNLTSSERVCVSSRLPAALLATATAQSDPRKASVTLHLLLGTLSAYRIRFDAFPGTVEAIKAFAERDFESVKNLLLKLYDARVARKTLIKENFQLIQTDKFYVNLLRHDVSILHDTTKFEELIVNKNLDHEIFFRKLAVYFPEKNGLAERYRTVLEKRAHSAPDRILARPLALLSGSSFQSLLKVFHTAPTKTPQRQLCAGLRANAHVVRPQFDIDSFGWRALGAKAVTNRVATCRQLEVERYFQETLTWNRTLRLAVVLSKRIHKEYEAFKKFSSDRPSAALFSSLRYFRNKDSNNDRCIWDIVKSYIEKTNARQLRSLVTQYQSIPTAIKAEYCVLICKASQTTLPELEPEILSQISVVLPEVDGKFIYEAFDVFLKYYLKENYKRRLNNKDINHIGLFIGMIARFLILSTSVDMLEERIDRIGIPLFKQLEPKKLTCNNGNMRINEMCLDTLLLGLRYNKVYFDDKYVSCLPVFERLSTWMQTHLPIEKWFDKYVKLNLVTIYYKTVRHCLKQNPGLFSDESKKEEEAPNMLGTIFGQFLANEIEEWTAKYFHSVTELYGEEFVAFLKDYFYYHRDASVEKFSRAVIRTLLMKKSVASCILAKHIFLAFRDLLGSQEFVKDIETFL